jgi:hypothetical protein
MRNFLRVALASLLFAAWPILIMGQNKLPVSASKNTQGKAAGEQNFRTNVDETFDLDIDERTFTRENFEASTSVATDPSGGLDLQIGVALSAGRIDVLLRNVRGQVRFRGTLSRVLDAIGSRRAASPP